MTTFRDKLQSIRNQNVREQNKKTEANKKQGLVDPVTREDQLLGDLELVTDPNDLPSEIRKNLQANLGPIDTEAEIEAKGINKKKNEEDKENESKHNFKP